MAASIEQHLLHAALLCDLRPGGAPAYRLQLFFIANRDLGSPSHQNDFQRALETAVDRKGFFANAEVRGSGEYVLTDTGFREAKALNGAIEARYCPTRKQNFRCTITGKIVGIHVDIRTRAGQSIVLFDGKRVPTAIEACRRLELRAGVHLPTAGDSAVRVLQDFALDRRFRIEFK